MTEDQVEYFQIEVVGGEDYPPNLYHYTEKGELFISPAGRLCGPAAAAMIGTLDITKRFADALLPHLQRKHGESVKLLFVKCSPIVHPSSLERDKRKIKEHTDKISRWLETKKG